MEKLLTHTDSLLNHVFWFKHDLNLQPSKEHFGTAIDYTDIDERKHDFLKELVNTVAGWVYSKTRIQQIVDERLQEVNDPGNAYSFLTTQAFSKFRPGHPQGQFGELLLFNFIQHFFRAVPLLRKQIITTSTGHERFGADAIHFKESDTSNVLILGESKCYKSDYQFKGAFKASLNSIESTFDNLDRELDLYTYDDFLEPDLQKVAKKYKSNTLDNVHFELVCLIAYNEKKAVTGENESEIRNSIKARIEEQCANIDASCFAEIESRVLNRINFIIFPIWRLDELLHEFQHKVRVA